MSLCDLTDKQIRKRLRKAFERGWRACLEDIQKARLEREERKRVTDSP